MYSELGNEIKQRYKRYKVFFDKINITEQEAKITEVTLRGEVYGSNRFHAQVKTLTSRVTKLAAHGGDRKSEKYHNQLNQTG